MSKVSSSNGLGKCPKLRFPGFDELWETKPLGSLGTFTKGAPLSKADISLNGTPLILYGELYTTYSEVTYIVNRKTDQTVAPEYYSRIGDVIIPTSGETAEDIATATCVMVPGVILAGDLNIFRTVKVDGRIVSYIIKNKVNRKISSLAQGKSVVHISAAELAKINISFPSKAEQRKILELLKLLDDKIAKQSQFISIFKKYKRGLQNRFFLKRSHLSRTISGISSHEVKPLGSKVQINPKTESLPEAFIYIDLECVEAGVLYSKKLISRNSAPSRAQRLLKEGDLIYQMVRPYQKNNYYFQKAFEYPTVASTGYAQIRCSEVDTQFIYEQLSSDYFAREAMLRSTGTGYPAINADDLGEIPIWIPPLDQQEKVGATLSFIGAKIEVHQKMLYALCRVKSSLLQQLFI